MIVYLVVGTNNNSSWPVVAYKDEQLANAHAELAANKARQFHPGPLRTPQLGWSRLDPRLVWDEKLRYVVVPVNLTEGAVAEPRLLDELAAETPYKEVCPLHNALVPNSACRCKRGGKRKRRLRYKKGRWMM